jgi:hypothetical protein
VSAGRRTLADAVPTSALSNMPCGKQTELPTRSRTDGTRMMLQAGFDSSTDSRGPVMRERKISAGVWVMAPALMSGCADDTKGPICSASKSRSRQLLGPLLAMSWLATHQDDNVWPRTLDLLNERVERGVVEVGIERERPTGSDDRARRA